MSTQPAVLPVRCSYRSPQGRQCRLLSTDPRSGLCPRHLSAQKDPDDLTKPLLANCQGFQTAQGINFSLGNLYKLLAANRISPRRASVLAFISSLLLHTLPAIDSDNEADITDPDAPPPAPIQLVHPTDATLPPLAVTDSFPEPDATKKPS
jgi:hypothetical protein